MSKSMEFSWLCAMGFAFYVLQAQLEKYMMDEVLDDKSK